MRTAAARLVALLTRYGLTVTTAESCTGGLVSAAITTVPGASSVLDGAIVTYSPAVKGRFLEIDPAILYEVGVVSAECAKAMAEGAAKLFAADSAVALTGYAGPGGGDEENPVGTVYIAATLFGETAVRRLTLSGDRDAVREGAAQAAINLLCEQIEEKMG
ncbi:MAG: nicotinamide-nucleotide amidohydrolase family protein [Clostridia bacterium]|nr:nicotinamide-nucleotide amidohydrolase family protein [Clostridia bacterium]